jgi:hypothetical protein
MSVREANFNRKFRKEMEALGFKFDRVESHGTAPSIPDDAWVHSSGKSGWIEIKECESFPSKMPYRPGQALWLDEHWRNGGNCCTLLHLKKEQAVILVPGNESVQAERHFIDDYWEMIYTDNKNIWMMLKMAILSLREP